MNIVNMSYWSHEFLKTKSNKNCILDVTRSFDVFCCRYDVLFCVWRSLRLYDILHDVMTFFHIFDVMTHFLTLWRTFDMILLTHFLTIWHTFLLVMTYTCLCNDILTSWRIYTFLLFNVLGDVIICFLISWRIFCLYEVLLYVLYDVITYFLKSWRTCSYHDIFQYFLAFWRTFWRTIYILTSRRFLCFIVHVLT